MAKFPVESGTVAAAFNELARIRLCESSGSDYSADDEFDDLANLIESFLENFYYGVERKNEDDDKVEDERSETERCNFYENPIGFYSKAEDSSLLQSLLGCDWDGDEGDSVKQMIRNEIEIASKSVGMDLSSANRKRLLMNRLREKGLDAGLCKSRWERKGRFPGGDHEYIDVIVGGTRYMVEVTLEAEFTIARPSEEYQSLLGLFPSTFVGKSEEMKMVVRLMCRAAKESMKKMEMHLPPWRKNTYMQAKWFAPYKRTTRAEVTHKKAAAAAAEDDLKEKKVVGFKARPPIYSFCKVASARKVGFNLNGGGNLAMVLNGRGL